MWAAILISMLPSHLKRRILHVKMDYTSPYRIQPILQYAFSYTLWDLINFDDWNMNIELYVDGLTNT